MAGIFRQYSWVFDVLALLLCSFFLAKIAGLYVAKQLEVQRSVAVVERGVGPTEGGRHQRDFATYDLILQRNIFDSTEAPPEAPTAEGAQQQAVQIATGEAVKTSLNITVLGVLAVGDGRDSRSSATVQSGGSAGVYAVGDVESFAPNTKLTRVAPDRIEFLNAGRLEYAEVGIAMGANIFGPPGQDIPTVAAVAPRTEPGAKGIKEEAPGSYVIDQREVENAMQNLDQLYTQIRAVPNFSGGKVSGMKVLSVKGGSLFSKLGLQRGDVLQRINGIELDVRQGFQIFNQLKDARNLSVDLIRGGQPQTLQYEIR